MTIEEICGRFITGEISSLRSMGDGHINDTYIAETQEGSFVLQRLQRKMDLSKLEYNYALYSPVFEKNQWLFPEWIRSVEGKYFYTDNAGENWRMYPFIEGEIIEPPLTEELLYECGRGLARLHGILAEIKEKPRAVYPMLHDIKHYRDIYKKTLAGENLCAENRMPGIEKIIDSRIDRYICRDYEKQSTVHGDTKIANILFRTGKVIAFIDLDTMMTGSCLEDIADCVRSCCLTDGKPDPASADILMEGYESIAFGSMGNIRKELPFVLNKISFELALRYYTDSISITKKFKEKHPGYRLQRAEQLLESVWPETAD